MKRHQTTILIALVAFGTGFVTRDQLTWLWDHVLIYLVAIPVGGLLIWVYGEVTQKAAKSYLESIPNQQKKMVENMSENQNNPAIFDDFPEKFDNSTM